MTARGRFVLSRLALVAVAVLVTLVALELTLRQWPSLLGRRFVNGALTRYTTGPGGIYYYDRSLGMQFMIPNHRTTMVYNGYVWQHETDALGFRNRRLHVPADVVLLGDSVVYGHGVDFEHTLGHYLEQRTGLRTVNLGRQSDCAFQQAYLLTEYLPLFRPRFVVHVFSPNDIEDLYVHLSDAAMAAFVAQPLDRIVFPPRLDPATLVAARERRLRNRSLARRAEQDLYVMKLWRWLQWEYADWRAVPRAEAADPRRATGVRASADPASLGWRYTEHALAYMNGLAGRAGARFLTVPYVQGRELAILRDVTARTGSDVVDTTRLFTVRWELPGDGHLSPEGARTLADLVAAALERLSAATPSSPSSPGRP
jgi:hypothetical protein